MNTIKRLHSIVNKNIQIKSFDDFIYQNKKLTKSQKIWQKNVELMSPSSNLVSPCLTSNYLYDFTEKELNHCPKHIKDTLSLSKATDKQLLAFKKKAAITKFQIDINDTGSPVVQIACMSEKIVHLLKHCISNNKDYKTKRKIVQIFQKRKKMLAYLMKKDLDKYIWVIKEYEIPDLEKTLPSIKMLKQPHKRGCLVNKKDYSGSKDIRVGEVKQLRKESRDTSKKPSLY